MKLTINRKEIEALDLKLNLVPNDLYVDIQAMLSLSILMKE